MGISLSALDAFAQVYERHGPFGRTLQIGRQGLFVPPHDYEAADDLLNRIGANARYEDITNGTQFADERLLTAFGADPALSADASAYENATIVHDFNDPIPETLHQSFDTVFDGGSLEHIFNVPVALANMMNLLKVGGRLLTIVPANNWLGHGFYQFGPELPFRVFQAENGFRLEFVKFSGIDGHDTRRDLFDRGAEGVRNEVGATAHSVELIFLAVKTEHQRPFQIWPQQGDYRAEWERVKLAHGGS